MLFGPEEYESLLGDLGFFFFYNLFFLELKYSIMSKLNTTASSQFPQSMGKAYHSGPVNTILMVSGPWAIVSVIKH